MSQSGALPVKGAVLNVVSRSLQTGATEGGDDGGTDEAASATAAASIEPPFARHHLMAKATEPQTCKFRTEQRKNTATCLL